MTSEQARATEHQVVVAAPPDVPYGIIADVETWPYFFLPTVHAERIAGDSTQERIRLWAIANGEVRTWTSRRTLDRDAFRVEFEQEVTSPPVAAMSGLWTMRPGEHGHTIVTLQHSFRAIGDDPQACDWIEQSVQTNSIAELASVKRVSEQHGELGELLLSFDDTVQINGPADETYAFFRDAQFWPDRLPHVERVELTESEPGVQRLRMETRAPAGDVHETLSFRVLLPGKIVYKQTVMPPIMTAHTGQWVFTETETGVLVTAKHTAMIARDKVTEILGVWVGLARERVGSALRTNSKATLEHGKAHVESRAEGVERPAVARWS